jgi:(p)ppGpp synthase/HD superfamily hydrolase
MTVRITESIAEAFKVAERAHGDQRYGDEPYVAHLRETLDVARSFWPDGHDVPEHVLVAAVLHDVVEDTVYPPKAIADQFGPDVARIVLLVTDPAHGTRAERKAHVARGLTADREAAYVKLCDRLANARRIDSKRYWKLYTNEMWTLVSPLVDAHPELEPLAAQIREALDNKRPLYGPYSA